ncbi:hypothetical protein, partial [Peribacillus muralis]|uniref:hypothetical protein n=1 Tax=Peribacillus muralis TaxID=264697 RepID=UPI001F3F213D
VSRRHAFPAGVSLPSVSIHSDLTDRRKISATILEGLKIVCCFALQALSFPESRCLPFQSTQI